MELVSQLVVIEQLHTQESRLPSNLHFGLSLCLYLFVYAFVFISSGSKPPCIHADLPPTSPPLIMRLCLARSIPCGLLGYSPSPRVQTNNDWSENEEIYAAISKFRGSLIISSLLTAPRITGVEMLTAWDTSVLTPSLVRFQVFTAAIWRCLVGCCAVTHRPDDGSSKHLWNISQFLRDYTA
jgi:hypothetical protein